MTKKEMTSIQKGLAKWQERHADINSLRKAYREKILKWVADSMEFEKEPVDINRLRELLKKEKIVPGL
ncbi:MAG: hypothetical protein Q7T53_13370 [Deltaproteobacteria bacterium]|nr:hypothetical protein [Deltaproteobacteria bacterium]